VSLSRQFQNSDKLYFLGCGETAHLVCCICPGWWMMLSVEQSVELVFGENLPQRHFVHHKSHMTWPEFEPMPPWWETEISFIFYNIKSIWMRLWNCLPSMGFEPTTPISEWHKPDRAANALGDAWCRVLQLCIVKELRRNSMAWVRERTVPTERPPLVGEVSANFCSGRKRKSVKVFLLWNMRQENGRFMNFVLSFQFGTGVFIFIHTNPVLNIDFKFRF
jgi:hypothetical protein